ncbi:MAG: DUF4365 domain-containing protein [Bacteroidales bacterium]|jgi:hypothetical protein|nr:DUF4365 domain-containing protein [Bacteroidales bacterium]
MMTEEHIKENISLRYLELIAACNGYKACSSYPDYGTDLEIKEINFREENSRKRYFDTGRDLKFQLKATIEKNVEVEDGFIKYDLDASTYNDLITRKKSKSPLILVVFILPQDKDEWLKISNEELIVKKCAYWFIPESSDITTNASSIRIAINKSTQLIQINTLNQLFEQYS